METPAERERRRRDRARRWILHSLPQRFTSPSDQDEFLSGLETRASEKTLGVRRYHRQAPIRPKYGGTPWWEADAEAKRQQEAQEKLREEALADRPPPRAVFIPTESSLDSLASAAPLETDEAAFDRWLDSVTQFG